MKFRVILCLTLFCAGANADPTEIDDPDVLKSLRAVHDALGSASRAITACANDGGGHQECACKHQDLVVEFNAAVYALKIAHPEVVDYGTVNFRDTNGSTIALNIAAMIRRAENPPVCNQQN